VRFFQERFRDTKYTLLHLLGRNTSFNKVAFSVGIISLFAAIAEETLFRGFLFTAIAEFMNENVIAFIISSIVSGLVRFPDFSVNTSMKVILSSVMCVAFIASGCNLVVPIFIHALYDFGTIMRSWISASSDLKDRLRDSVRYQLARGKKPGTGLAGPDGKLDAEPSDDLREMSHMVSN
jgi:membrane protease YdiL (CAAX protease family)